jgi:hypothetical protein
MPVTPGAAVSMYACIESMQTRVWIGASASACPQSASGTCIRSHHTPDKPAALFIIASQVNMTDVRALIVSMAACMVLPNPGMSCPLATSLMNPDYQVE